MATHSRPGSHRYVISVDTRTVRTMKCVFLLIAERIPAFQRRETASPAVGDLRGYWRLEPYRPVNRVIRIAVLSLCHMLLGQSVIASTPLQRLRFKSALTMLCAWQPSLGRVSCLHRPQPYRIGEVVRCSVRDNHTSVR